MNNVSKNENMNNNTYNEKNIMSGDNFQTENYHYNRQQRRRRERNEKRERARSERIKKYKSAVIGLTVAVSILAATTLGLGVAYGITQSQANAYGTQLENVYQKNYYELVDNVNNTDNDMSKLLNASSSSYQKKLLMEIANSSKNMQNNISYLPVNGENVLESVRFVNQLSGYTATLEDKVSKGESLTADELATLSELHDTLISMKQNLNRMSMNMRNGYSILDASNQMNGELNNFSVDFSQIKSNETDYPTMIYDGPFSDSVVNQKITGLSGSTISKDDAVKEIDEVFKNISNISYEGETNGRFETYNYKIKTTDEQNLYIQVTKTGGHILTVSGQNESDMKNIDMATGEKVALEFANRNGVKNAEVVWSEELDNQAYFNIATVKDGVIIYPELVKVKVDMEHGNVIGYDAITYWTNLEANRDIKKAGNITVKIPDGFTVKSKRLCLAPLEYNREVLCYEYQCEKEGITYYFYFNAQTGVEENILKVVQTADSSKLM